MDTPAPDIDLTQLTDAELDQLEAQVTGQAGSPDVGKPVAGPSFDDVLKGLRGYNQDPAKWTGEALKAGSDPAFAQKMLDRHAEFVARSEAGENPLESGDFELRRWQKAMTAGTGPGAAELVWEGAKTVAKEGFELGVETMKNVALSQSSDRELQEQASREGIDLGVVGAAKAFAINNALVRTVDDLAHRGYTAARKLFAGESQREFLTDLHERHSFEAERANYADFKTAEEMHKNVATLWPTLSSIVGTTEVNQAAANMLSNVPQMGVEGLVARSVTRAGVATATGEMRQAVARLAEKRQELAAKRAVGDAIAANPYDVPPRAVAAVRTDIAKLEADIGVREQAIHGLQERAKAEFEELTQAATSRVAAGKVLGLAGRSIEKVGGLVEKLQQLPQYLAERIAPNSPELHQRMATTIATTAAAGVGYTVGGTEGAMVGGLFGVAGGGGPVNRHTPGLLSTVGKDIRRTGEVFAAGQAVLPFWRNVQKARDVSGFLRGTASFFDNSALASVAQVGAGITKGAVAGGAVGAAFGALQSPDNMVEGAASGFGAGAMFGSTVGFLGQWRSYANSGQMMRERAGQTRLYKDILQARPDELKIFEKLPQGTQEQIALYTAAHPDLKVRYVNDPHQTAGHYDAMALPDVVTVNLASSDPLVDIVGHEIAHYTENHELGETVVKKALGDPEAGIPGDYTARDPNSGEPLYEGGDLKKFQLNDEFKQMQQAYLARLDATAQNRGWTEQELNAAKQAAQDPAYIAREIWAEQHLAYLQSERYVGDLKGHFAVPDWVMNSAFLKNALGKLGVAFKADGEVIESTILGDYKKSETFQGLLREYYRRRASSKAGDVEFTGGDTRIDDKQLTKATGYVERYFDATGEIVRDTNGNPLFDAEGRAIRRARAEADADAKAVGKALVAHLDGAATKGEPVDPNIVQKQTTADGRTVYAGRYFSDAAIEAIARAEKFNAVQLDNLRQMNAELKEGYGREWTTFYQAATKKGGGNRYHPLAGRWRTDLVYGFQLSLDNNILAQSVSLEVLAQNAAKAVKLEQAKLWNNELGPLLNDIKTYLSNLAELKPGETGLSIEKKNFLNNLLGIRVKAEGDVNPWFEVSTAPKTILTSLRLDRMNRVSPEAERNVPFSAESYNRAKKNLRPEVIRSNTSSGSKDAADAGTVGDMARKLDAKGEGGQRSGRGNGPRVVAKNGRGTDDAARPAQAASARTDEAQVQHAGKRLEHAVTEDAIQLVHYSGNAGLKSVDPKFLGRGAATQNDLRGLNKSFFYAKGSKLGADKGLVSGQGKSAYAAKVSGERIYDGYTDNLGYWEIINREKADQMLVDEGYVGLAVEGDDGRKTVSMFRPTKVERIETSGKESRAGLQHRPDSRPTNEQLFKNPVRYFRKDDGQPEILYRAHRDNDAFKATERNTLPTFTDSKDIAGVYAGDSGRGGPGSEGSRVGRFTLDIKNPLRVGDLTEPVVQYGHLLSELTKGGKVTEAEVRAWANDFDQWVYDGEQVVLSHGEVVGDPGGVYSDANRVADNPGFLALAKKAGYDGYLYRGVFTSGDLLERGAKVVEADSSYDDLGDSSLEARPFFAEQVHEAPVTKGEQFRPDAPRVFVSPNKGNLDYPTAKQRLTEEEHRAFITRATELAKAVDPEARVQSGLGDWVDGAEDSVSIQFSRGTNPDDVARVAAQLGLEGEQKAVVQLVPDEKGKSTLFEVKFPEGTSLDDARQALTDSGIKDRTLLPTDEGVTAFVFDEHRELAQQMAKLAAHELAPEIEGASVRPAVGDSAFLGSFNDRDEGAAAFRRVLEGPAGRGNQAEGAAGPDTPAQLRPDAGQVAARGVSTAPLFEKAEPLPAASSKAEDIGRALAARSRQLKRIPYDSRTPQAKDAMATTVADEIAHALTRHDNARGWYDANVKEAMAEFTKLHPEIDEDPARASMFKLILAITSNGQKVHPNAERAEYLYQTWKDTGRLETDAPWGAARTHQINDGLKTLQDLIDARGLEATVEFLNKRHTVGELKKLGFNVSGEAVDHKVWGAAIFGPKVGAGFYANLNGDFSPVTMDLWLMRTWNRINGSYGVSDPVGMGRAIADLRKIAEQNPEAPESAEIGHLSDRQLGNWAEKRYTKWKSAGHANPTPLLRAAKRFSEAKAGQQESPRNSSERAWVREVFQEVDSKLAARGLPAISNADKQALLWYYEKDLYSLFGYRDRNSAPQDYAAAARAVVAARQSAAAAR
jgi:hypothetical protein